MTDDLKQKIEASIERLRAFEPEEGYYLAFSGGKDSVVCKALMDMAGVKYDATYRVTSVDPPELVRFIKEVHPDVKREIPLDKDGKPITMWNLIPRKSYPPTRRARYCCSELKETGGDGRMTVTGVRWAESVNRKINQGLVTLHGKSAIGDGGESEHFSRVLRGGFVLVNDNEEARRMVEQCYKRRKTLLNPIIDWSDNDVWSFISYNNVKYCGLYDEGWTRLGCIGCPMANKKRREREFLRWPKYKQAYLRAFKKMLEARKEHNAKNTSRPIWKQNGTPVEDATPVDVFNWWMEYDILPGQMDLFEEDE